MENWLKRLNKDMSLSKEVVLELAAYGELETFQPGDMIVHAGEVNDNLYIVTEGIWREYFDTDNGDITVWFSVAGEITYSVWGYAMGAPAHLGVESLTESKAYCIPKAKLEELYESSLKMANIGRRMIEAFAVLYEQWHINRWQKNATERYLDLMEDYPEVIQSVPHKYVASYLGITVQSLSRIRADVKHNNLYANG